MGLDRFERRYLGLGGGEGGGLEAGCDGDGVFAVTVVDWIEMSVARAHGWTHGIRSWRTLYGRRLRPSRRPRGAWRGSGRSRRGHLGGRRGRARGSGRSTGPTRGISRPRRGRGCARGGRGGGGGGASNGGGGASTWGGSLDYGLGGCDCLCSQDASRGASLH